MSRDSASRSWSAFEERCGRFEAFYEQRPPAQVPWITSGDVAELASLVIDGSIQRGSTFVDLGCGAGRDAIFMALQGLRVIGIDLSAEALGIASAMTRLLGLECSWVLGDAFATPLSDGIADLANDCFVFHNLRADLRRPYAEEVHRILKPAGLFVLRGFSDRMDPGSGPVRLSSDAILEALLPWFSCESLYRYMGLPTETRANQWHWMSLWRRRDSADLGFPSERRAASSLTNPTH